MIHLALWIVSFLIVCGVINALFTGLGEAISLPFTYLFDLLPNKYQDFLKAYKLIIYLTLLTLLVLLMFLKENQKIVETENIAAIIKSNTPKEKPLTKTPVKTNYGNPWIVSTINTSERELLLIISLDKKSPSLKETPQKIFSDIKPFLCNGVLKEIDLETIEVSIALYEDTKKIKNNSLPKSYCNQT